MKTKPAPANCVTPSATNEEFKEMTGMIKQMTADMAKLKKQSRQNFRGLMTRDLGGYQQQNRYPNQEPQQQQEPEQPNGDGPTCWRCGQKGHIKLGCRVRIDHLNQGKSSK